MASAADTDASRLFVFGLGYTGLGLVRHLQRQGGWHCSGTCRTPDKAALLAQSGVDAHLFDPDNLHILGKDALQSLAASTHILSTIAPNADFDRDPVRPEELTCRLVLVLLAASAVQHLSLLERRAPLVTLAGAESFQGTQRTVRPRSPARQVLQSHASELAGLGADGRVRWAGYVSSTSVYGGWGGAWVDERCGLPGAAQHSGAWSSLRMELAVGKLAQLGSLPPAEKVMHKIPLHQSINQTGLHAPAAGLHLPRMLPTLHVAPKQGIRKQL